MISDRTVAGNLATRDDSAIRAATNPALPTRVILCECAARDGLQHEARFVPTADKIAMIKRFVGLGFTRIEATSFSHPKHVPQFADADEVLQGLADLDGISLKATCVNRVAVSRAVKAREGGWGPDEISLVVSASETHSIRSAHRTHEQIRAEFTEAAADAIQSGLNVGGTIGTAFGCPFSGWVSDQQVAEWVGFFLSQGVSFISLGDTTGMAQPWGVKQRLATLMEQFPQARWGVHFHDTRGLALANCAAAIEQGVDRLDSAFGGLGGFPAGRDYARGHTGNASTEDLVAMLAAAGIETGLDLGQLLETSLLVERTIGRTLESRVARAGLVSDLME